MDDDRLFNAAHAVTVAAMALDQGGDVATLHDALHDFHAAIRAAGGDAPTSRMLAPVVGAHVATLLATVGVR